MRPGAAGGGEAVQSAARYRPRFRVERLLQLLLRRSDVRRVRCGLEVRTVVADRFLDVTAGALALAQVVEKDGLVEYLVRCLQVANRLFVVARDVLLRPLGCEGLGGGHLGGARSRSQRQHDRDCDGPHRA